MLSYSQALALAQSWVRIISGDRARVVEDAVVKKPYGWIFFYQSIEFLETGDKMKMLMGNAPFVIDRIDGELRVMGTGRPLDAYLAEYEATLPKARLQMALPSQP